LPNRKRPPPASDLSNSRVIEPVMKKFPRVSFHGLYRADKVDGRSTSILRVAELDIGQFGLKMMETIEPVPIA
jgi:hypothetical protein